MSLQCTTLHPTTLTDTTSIPTIQLCRHLEKSLEFPFLSPSDGLKQETAGSVLGSESSGSGLRARMYPNTSAHICPHILCVSSYLREKGASYKLFVLEEGDALAAVQLFSQVSHVRLQLCKPCYTNTQKHNCFVTDIRSYMYKSNVYIYYFSKVWNHYFH